MTVPLVQLINSWNGVFLDSKKSKNDEEPISISDEEVESG